MSLTLSTYMEAINGQNLTPAIKPSEIELTGAYVSDMLSDVMGNAKPGQAWITIMKHMNVVAVASMAGIPAIIFAKDSIPDTAVVEKALEEGVCLICSSQPTFDVVGILYKLLGY
ncbi:MAG TPA: hypothetical protein PL124_06450 [Candidatus Cloacimonadota bacterium]|nr:hypothetical protein [Candidatus Cloacimonadota bacterium]